jgi:amino acid adenylation domain-containing protein
MTVEYSTELFDADRIERFAEHFGVIMAAIVPDPDVRISELEITTEAERSRMLDDWNPAPVPRESGLLHQLVAGRAAQVPDRVAMRFAGRDLSYGELDLRSNRLANLLADAGIAPGHVVGVLLERGFDLPAAELGVLKTGGAWLPLDPQYPAERLAYQLADANVSLVVTTSDLAGHLPARVSPVLLDSGVLDGQPDTAPAVAVNPEDVAYVIYTSGSTGKPKGVMVPHRAVVNFCAAFRELFAITADDRILQFSNPAFDVSVSDFFATFAAGATVVGAPRSVLLDPDALQGLLAEERVTVMDIPPPVLGLLNPEPLVSLRVLFIGMEPFGPELVNRWARPGREFHNGYGPTEVTITCVDYRCPDEVLTAPPPIGRAMANHRAYVLDRRLRPAPIGVPGELYMAGAGLAHGYLGRTDLTAEKFVPDPYGNDPGARMYATGDLARWRADGNLEFLGRVDRQVKIRGLRIELGEIENAVNTYPGVRQCVVIVREPGTPEAYLAAYVVSAPGPSLDGDKLRDYLADRLPLHMIPAVLSLAELPLTAAGKLDAARLPAPAPQTARYAPPETGTQLRLAEMWRELLKTDAAQIGIHDNFFILGGNSLQAIQLIARIRDTFSITLHPRQLFTYPVLGQLAAQIDQLWRPESDASGHEMPVLVPIQPGGARPPLFFVHAVGGSVTPYVALASLLGADQPFYGLEHPGLHGETAAQRIPEIAARYLTAIRAVQPVGPFHLGGWSFGGAVALEMARQLRAAGEEVALVVALDTGVPAAAYEPDQAELLSLFVGDIAGLASSELPPMDLTALRELPASQQVDAALAALGSAGLGSEEVREELRNRIKVFSANSRAYLAHLPDRYNGRVVLVSAADEPDDDVERWRALAPEDFEHHVVPGNHYTMLQPPRLSAVAAEVRRCLHDPTSG